MTVTRSKRVVETTIVETTVKTAILPSPTKVTKPKKDSAPRTPTKPRPKKEPGSVSPSKAKPKLDIEELFKAISVPEDLALPQWYIDHHHEEFIKGVNFVIAKDPSLYPVFVHAPFHCFAKEELPTLSETEQLHNYWYALIRSILGQQISGSAAKAIEERFKALLADDCTPAAVLRVDQETLRAVGLSGQKLKYITHISEVFSNPEAKLTNTAFYKESNNDELVAELTKLKGVGEWSARMFSVFTLKELDIFAYDDLGVARGVARYLNNRPVLLKEVKDGVHAVEELKAGLKKKGKFMTPSSKRDWVPLHDEYVKFLGLMFAPYQSVFMFAMWRLASTNVEVLENIR